MQLPDRAALHRLVGWVVGAAIAWSVLVLAAMLAWGGEELWRSLRASGPSLAMATAGSFAVNHGLRFVRWQGLLRAEGHRVAWRRSLSMFLAGLALLPTPAKAGVAVRSLLLLREGVPVHVSLAAYFAERLTDLLGLLVLASLLWMAAGEAQGWLLPLAVAGSGIALVWATPAVLRAVRPLAAGRARALRALDWVARFFADAAEMLAGWRLPAFVLLGLAANVATGLLLWHSLRDAAAQVAPPIAVGVLAASHLSGSISMLPGGLGGFEIAMLAQLAALAVPGGQALVALGCVRLVTLWGSVAVGLPLLFLGLRRGAGGSAGARVA